MRAKDIMTPNVITVRQDVPVSDVAELLLEKKITAVPVVGEDGRLAGIVSEGDLVRRLSEGADDDRPWWLKMMATNSDGARDFIKSHGRTAGDVMTRNVVSVNEDTELNEVAHVLEANRIKRVPVVTDGKVVGIISRSNMLQVIAGQKTEVKKPASVSDRELRKQVYDSLSNQGFASHGSLNVIVDDGVVELWGWVETEEERKALLLTATEIDGVKEVRDHFGKISPWVWGA